jgi:S-adenosylmethionine/arginine decarboxylase-like enzyme
MKRFGEFNIVKFGEDEKVAGYSFVQLIETSLVSGHLVDHTNNAFIDIFSCKDYDSTEAGGFLQKEFEAEHMFYHKINRYY